jgi:hypothetical protein
LLFLGACAPAVAGRAPSPSPVVTATLPPGVTEAQAAPPPSEGWLPAYDLARAYARAGDERAQPALDAALEHGGEAARQRALRDPDFDGVRTGPWFRRMVGSP